MFKFRNLFNLYQNKKSNELGNFEISLKSIFRYLNLNFFNKNIYYLLNHIYS